MDEEFRQLLSQYSEVKSALNALNRKKGTNLNTGALEELLTAEIIEKATGGKPKDEVFLNSEFLKTALVVVKKEEEKNFREVYETLGEGMISVPVGKSTLKCPVLPRSAM